MQALDLDAGVGGNGEELMVGEMDPSPTGSEASHKSTKSSGERRCVAGSGSCRV